MTFLLALAFFIQERSAEETFKSIEREWEEYNGMRILGLSKAPSEGPRSPESNSVPDSDYTPNTAFCFERSTGTRHDHVSGKEALKSSKYQPEPIERNNRRTAQASTK